MVGIKSGFISRSVSKQPVKVVVVKKPRKRHKGPKITNILKDKTTFKLNYVDTIVLDAPSVGITSTYFRANGLESPAASGGHQPLGFDQHKLYYNKYRVLSSKIKISPINDASSNVVPSLYGVFRDTNQTLTFTTGTAIIEDPRNVGGWGISGGLATSSSHSGNGVLNSRRASYNAKMQDPDARGQATDTTTNPGVGSDVYYQIWSSSINGNNPGTAMFLIELEYVAEFTDPIHLAQS